MYVHVPNTCKHVQVYTCIYSNKGKVFGIQDAVGKTIVQGCCGIVASTIIAEHVHVHVYTACIYKCDCIEASIVLDIEKQTESG